MSPRGFVALALATFAAASPAAAMRLCTLVPWVAEAFAEPVDGVEVAAAAPRWAGGPVAEGAIDLGSPHTPDLERLASARCGLVVADRRLHAEQRGALDALPSRLLWVGGGSIDATFASLLEVAESAGEAPARTAMATRVAAARRELEALRSSEPLPALALFGAPGSWLAMTADSWLGDLIATLGWRNLADGAGQRAERPGFVPLSDEWLLTLEPRVVLLLAHGDPAAVEAGFRREASRRPAFGALAARVRVLDPELFGANPGLRLPDAARRLREIAGGGAG